MTLIGSGHVFQVKEDLAPVPPNRRLLRVVLDPKGRTPQGARVVDGSAPTLVVTGPGTRARWPKAEHAEVATDAAGRIDLGGLLEMLHGRGVQTLLVEGGAQVLRSFLQSPFVDTWTLYQAPVLVGGQGPSIFDGRPSMIGRRLHVENVEPRGKGVLWTIRP